MPDPVMEQERPQPPDKDVQAEKNGRWQPLVDHCFDLLEKFERSEYREKKIAAIKRSAEVYAQEEMKGVSFPWQDAFKINLPLYAITLDNLEPRIVAALVGKDPYVKFDMEGMTKVDPPTEIVQDWFNSELKHVVGVQKIARSLVHKLLKEGTVYIIPRYATESKVVRDFTFDGDPNIGRAPDPVGNPIPVDSQTQEPLAMSPGGMFLGQDGLPKIIEREEQIFEGVRADILQFEDVLTDDFADNWEEADVIRKVSIPYGELMRKKGQLGWISENISSDLLPLANDEKTEDEDTTGDFSINDVKIRSKKAVDCIECHVSYVYQSEEQEEGDLEDWTEERLVATIARDRRTLLRLVRLRDLRFTNEHVIRRHRIYEEPGLSYGSSLYEKLRGIQENCSDVFSLFMNVSILLMIPWYLYSNKAGIKQDQVIQPGKGIECDDPSAVVFPTWRVDLSSILKAIEIFFQLNERAGNIGDVQTGQIEASKADVKATEIMAMVQESNIKYNYSASTIKDDFIDFMKTVYDLYYQNMPYDRQFPYQGQMVPIQRTMMRRKVKFRLTGSTELSNKLMERKEAQEKYAMLRQDPIVNPVPLIADVIKHYDPDSQIQEYIDQDINMYLMAKQQNPELPQVIAAYLQQKAQQQQIMQQAMKAGAGQGGPPQQGPQQPQQPKQPRPKPQQMGPPNA